MQSPLPCQAPKTPVRGEGGGGGGEFGERAETVAGGLGGGSVCAEAYVCDGHECEEILCFWAQNSSFRVFEVIIKSGWPGEEVMGNMQY